MDSMPDQPAIQAFDASQAYEVVYRRLPHWSQPGTVCFITLRTWDSMPTHVLSAWLDERDAWLRHHGIDASRTDWRARVHDLGDDAERRFAAFVAERWDDRLNESHGACVLRRPALAAIVAESLCHFDGQRYELTDFVVMPNHVHLLAAFASAESMLAQCESWKHYTATRINRAMGRKGRFWQQDGFDHLVRSSDYFEHYRRYIAGNPAKARLKPGEYLHLSKPLPGSVRHEA